ncbi:hypothetical protein [Fumia xinanensis]|uniref:Uncharacterized protein n=1 Tax=Fumia xinanensis TaxID=2763659 RepID=A0A926E6D8_9FIRM|nr:hypothetical protein [Fumia xinanensis]MBC8560320.1 hypothetical protein [Fumia xinanensis]
MCSFKDKFEPQRGSFLQHFRLRGAALFMAGGGQLEIRAGPALPVEGKYDE